MSQGKSRERTKSNGNGNGNGASKWGKKVENSNLSNLSFGHADAVKLQAAIAAVTEDGAAVLLSKTSDGGALVVQVWNGSGRHKLYPTTMAELTEALSLITEIALDKG